MTKHTDLVAVVDDDVDELKAIARFLSSHGYRVRTFGSAERYLESPEADEVSCVVIDVNLGRGMSGLDLGRSILSSGRTTTIIFMTGSADQATRQEAMAMGCTAFLEKPYLGDRLITAIGGWRNQRS
jgi:FixJ family two-component response regulator